MDLPILDGAVQGSICRYLDLKDMYRSINTQFINLVLNVLPSFICIACVYHGACMIYCTVVPVQPYCIFCTCHVMMLYKSSAHCFPYTHLRFNGVISWIFVGVFHCSTADIGVNPVLLWDMRGSTRSL